MSTTITASNPSFNLNFYSKSHTHNPIFNSCWANQGSSYPFNISCKLGARNKFTILAKGTSDDSQEAGAPGTAKPPSSGWKNWILGIMLTIILPSFRHKWGPILLLKSKVDEAMEMVESVTEVVEEVAEEAEKLAKEVEKKLPEDTKLRDAAELVGDLAKEAVKKADMAQELINKVQDAEEEVEALLKSREVEAKTVSQETSPKDRDLPVKI